MDNIDFEIEQGSVGDKIAGYTTAALNMTTTSGLMGAATLAETLILTGASTAMNMAEGMADKVLDELSTLLENTGALSKVQEGVDAASNIIELLKKALDLAATTALVSSNLESATNLVGTMPEGTCIPSVKECTTAASASAKAKIIALYEDTKQQFVELYNSMIVTGCDATIDNVVLSVNNILDFISPYLDPLMQKYTGYTISEVRALCQQGFMYIKMLQRINQLRREEKAAEEEAESNSSNDNAENVDKDADATKDSDDSVEVSEDKKTQAKTEANSAVTTWWNENKGSYTTNEIGYELSGSDGKFNATWSGDLSNADKATQKNVKSTIKSIVSEAKSTYSSLYNKKLDEYKLKVKEEADALKNTATDAGNEIADTAKNTGTEITDQGKAACEDITNNATKAYEKLAQDYSKDKLMQKIQDWLADQSIVLLNAFHILVIKDMIEGIKEKCEKLGTCSIENFADFVNAANDVFEMFEMIGLTPDAKGITFDDLKAIGAATVGAVIDTAKSTADQVKDAGKQIAGTTTAIADSASQQATAYAAEEANNAYAAGQSTLSSAQSAGTNIASNVQSNVSNIQTGSQSAVTNAVTTSANIGTDTASNLTQQAATAASTTSSSVSVMSESSEYSFDTKSFISLWIVDNKWEDAYKALDEYVDKQAARVLELFPKSNARRANVISGGYASEYLNYHLPRINYLINQVIALDDDNEEEVAKEEEADNIINNISKSTLYQAVDKLMDKLIDDLKEEETDQQNFKNGTTYECGFPEATDDSKVYTVELKLYSKPNTTKLLAYLDERFVYNKKAIFNNATKKNIASTVTEIWDEQSDDTFSVTGKADKTLRTYNFNVIIKKQLKVSSDISDVVTPTEDTKQETLVNSSKSTATDAGNQLADTAESTANMVGDSATSTINSTASDVASGATSTVSNAASSASSLTSGATSGATNIINSAVSTSMMAATDIATSVNVSIDLSEVENILAGKVMMFDTVIQFLKVLQPVIEVLAILCHLLENYNINKETVATHAHKDLMETLKNGYLKILGLKDMIDLKDTNFYTVRTDTLSEWCKLKFTDLTINDAGMATISIAQTNLLNAYLATHSKQSTGEVIDCFKKTTLFFDGYAIKEGGFEDGTTDHMDDRIIVNTEANEVYYNSDGLSVNASEIYDAMMHNENATYIDETETTTETKSRLSSLIDELSVETDEFEGTQSINLADLNLCNTENPLPDEPVVPEEEQNKKAIIEFGQAYTRGTKVDYSLNVKPGQTINKDTILAYIQNDKNLIPVKSIFASGTIKSISNDTDYFHVYPLSCTRHIIIDNITLGDQSLEDVLSMNTEDMVQTAKEDKPSILAKKFSDSGKLYYFIVDNLCDSVLPTILKHRHNGATSNAIKLFDDFLDDGSKPNRKGSYHRILEYYLDQFNDLKDKIANVKVMNDISEDNPNSPGNLGKALLKQMYEDIKYLYNTADSIICEGTKEYSDCTMLAYTTKTTTLSNIKYENYYVNLLSKIDLSVDNEYITEYYNILKDIINKRITIESYDYATLVTQFNNLFITNIKTMIDNPYDYVSKHFVNANPEYTEIYQYLIDNYSKSDDNKVGICKQLATIFYYIKTQNPEKIQSVPKYVIDRSQVEKTFLNLYNDYFGSPANDLIETAKKKYKLVYNDNINYPFTKNKINAFISKITNGQSLETTMATKLYKMIAYIYNVDTNVNAKIVLDSDVEKYIRNRLAYELVLEESTKIEDFWKKTIIAYETEYLLDVVIKELKDYANEQAGVDYATWPSSFAITINGIEYDHYIFQNRTNDPEVIDDDKMTPNIPDQVDNPGVPELDYTAEDEIEEPKEGDISMLDYKYWLVYMLNATLITLIPSYWASGDFPSPVGLIQLPMPAVYFPIAPPVQIPKINVLMVFGLAYRPAINFSPIIIMVNMNDHDINVLTPVMVALELAKAIFQTTMTYLENGIPNLVNGMINKMSEDNQGLKNAIEKYKTYAALIKSIPFDNKAAIEREFYDALDNAKQNVNNSIEESKKTRAQKKAEKKDKRQVITRTEKLGDGAEPM